MQNIPMTKTGLIILKKKLNTLKNIQRPKNINELQKAREYGDLKENAEYHAAKEEQFLIEKTIRDIESKITHANVIDIKNIQNTNKINFLATVKLTNIKTQKKMEYKIVGEDEANINNKKISINSPIAKALIGKKINCIVKIKVPTGILMYKINNINYI